MTDDDPRAGELVDDDYQWELANRRYKVYSLTETELDTMIWAPWWVRRRIITRIRNETTFDDDEPLAA